MSHPLQDARMTAQIRFKTYPDQVRDFDKIVKATNRKKAEVLRGILREFIDGYRADKHFGSTDPG